MYFISFGICNVIIFLGNLSCTEKRSVYQTAIKKVLHFSNVGTCLSSLSWCRAKKKFKMDNRVETAFDKQNITTSIFWKSVEEKMWLLCVLYFPAAALLYFSFTRSNFLIKMPRFKFWLVRNICLAKTMLKLVQI